MQPFIKVILIILAVVLVVWGTEWLLTDHVVHKFSNNPHRGMRYPGLR